MRPFRGIAQAVFGLILGASILGATAATVGNSNLDPNDFTVSNGGLQPATGSTPPLLSLTQTGVISGTYNNATIDVTSTGRITRAVSGATGGVTSVNGKAGAVTLTLNSSDFANEGTTTTVLHGNAAGNPSFGSVNLSTDVTGNLSTGNLNGGAGASATTAWCGNGTWCTPSSGSGTVNSGTAGNVAWYAGTGTAIDGNQVANLAQGKLTLGVAASTIGQLALAGNTSGTVTVTPVAATSNWTLTLPSTSGTNGQFLQTDGSGTASWQSTGNAAQAVTRQLFMTGSGATYTTPANATQLRVLECAGGGGSGGLGAGAGTGGIGGTSTFNSVTAIGGSGGTGTTTTTGGVGGVGGTGGAGSLGTGGIRIKGGDGSDGGNVVGAIAQVAGGVGGVTRLGGFQAASASNNGAGADGDNSASVLTGGSGAGGGGECAEIIIAPPSPTYTYTVGTFGAAGAGATAGLAGNPGVTIVDEYYGATSMALTNHQVLLGTGSGIGTVSGTGTLNQVLTSSGAGIDPIWANAASGTVSSIATGTGLQGGTITSSGTLSLANTTVAPAAYTNTNLTVDAQGRITAASSGSAGSGTVNSATAGFLAFYATTGTAVSGVNNVPVSSGGTGDSTLTNHGVLLGQGTSPIVSVSTTGTIGQVLTSSGAGIDPVWVGHRGARVHMTSQQTINNNTVTTLTWGATDFDTNVFWSAGSPTVFTVPAGVSQVRIYTSVGWVAGAFRRDISVIKNGGSFAGTVHSQFITATGAPSIEGIISEVTGTITVSAGDTFAVQAFQNSGVGQKVDNQDYTWFEIEVLQ